MKNVEITEKTLGAINVGKSADIVFNHMRPILDRLEAQAIATLKNDFRAGKFDGPTVQSKIAELVAYDNIRTELTGQITRGSKALKGTHD